MASIVSVQWGLNALCLSRWRSLFPVNWSLQTPNSVCHYGSKNKDIGNSTKTENQTKIEEQMTSNALTQRQKPGGRPRKSVMVTSWKHDVQFDDKSLEKLQALISNPQLSPLLHRTQRSSRRGRRR